MMSIRLGKMGMVSLVQKRWDGLQKTCQRLGRNTIDIQVKSGYELVLDDNLEIVGQISLINSLLKEFFQEDVFRLSDNKIESFGFSDTHHLIENHLEGQLDTGKLISSLWQYCSEIGVQIHTGFEVTEIEENSNEITISGNHLSFNAKKVGICTNAFTRKLLPNYSLNLKPGRGIVLSITPSQPLKFEGTFHYQEGYYYFRDYYGKLLFGGGRNLAKREETTIDFGINEKIKEKLIKDINQIVIPNQAYEIEMEWSGIMAFGESKKPIIEKVSDSMVIGARLGGMGVAIGSLVGEEVAELLLD